MSLASKNTLSLRKKDVKEQKSIGVGFKKTQFAHRASAGESGIDLTSLVLPTEMSSLGFTNPNTSDLTAANIFFYRKNVTIISSLRGELIQDLSYTIRSSSFISFQGFTAEEGEIFVGIVDHNPSTTLQVVDASPIAVNGSLAVGQTDFNVGTAFQVGQTPQKILVYRNGLVQTRNSNNSSTVLDGNYYEVDSGDGSGILIRFNDAASGQADSIIVVSVGSLVEKPTASQLQEIEKVQGQIDALVPTVAQLAGVDETDFQAAPNNVDLKQFGDRVINLENNKQDKFTDLSQAKTLNSDVIDSNTTVMTFNNLEIGKVYRIKIQAAISSPDGNNVNFSAIHDGNVLCRVQHEGENTSDDNLIAGSQSPAFVATTTSISLTTSGMIAGGNADILSGNGTFAETWAELEELPNTQLTTKWT